MSVKISLSDCVRGSRSSCQSANCEEDDGYVRKPRRQRKTTVRSGFPSLHWLILPLRERATKKGSLSQQFQFLKNLWQTARCRGCDKAGEGHQETCRLWWQLLCNVAVWKTNKMAKRMKAFLRKAGLRFTKTGCHKRMFGGVSGEFSTAICAFPGTRHILTKSVYVKHRERVRWLFCYLNQMCQSNGNFSGFICVW